MGEIILDVISEFNFPFNKQSVITKVNTRCNNDIEDIIDKINFYLDMLVKYKIISFDLTTELYKVRKD